MIAESKCINRILKFDIANRIWRTKVWKCCIIIKMSILKFLGMLNPFFKTFFEKLLAVIYNDNK